MPDDNEKAKKGMELVGRLFGAAAGGGGTPVPQDFLRYTLSHLFGDVWQGEHLALAERSLVTCAILVALGRENEQRAHFLGAKNLGIPREKVEATITHVAHYAGWPVAASAFRILGEVWPPVE